MNRGGFYESEVTLEHTKKGKIKFKIITNLPDVPGLRVQDAAENWSVRTEDFTAESFCNYINSKHTGFVAVTEEAYLKMLEEDDET